MQRIDSEDKQPIICPRASDILLRMVIYAELCGNTKKHGIKSPCGNKLNGLGQVVNRLAEVTQPLAELQSRTEKLFGGVVVTNMPKQNATEIAFKATGLVNKAAATSLEFGKLICLLCNVPYDRRIYQIDINLLSRMK